ncbi:MAG: elongation factor Ts [Gammaproteobacteria bacterium]|nr:elongation factor Ts [Gammaproteobacteria bacterium]
MEITAALVKELRERTGSGMMDCKKALLDARGDIEAAIEAMRKSGVAKAAKKAGRIAAEGTIVLSEDPSANVAVVVEVNCETDFVAKDGNFVAFARNVATTVLARKPATVAELAAMPAAGGNASVEEARQQLVAKLGENISVRRFHRMHSDGGRIGSYLHGTRIGVLVKMRGGDATLARDIAMHIAASRPVCVSESEVPRELIDSEREIYGAQARESGKPPEIVEKMVNGRIGKFIKEVTLLGQPFVKEPDRSVGDLLRTSGAQVATFVRFEVGEGIEKRSGDFAAEVRAQAGGA